MLIPTPRCSHHLTVTTFLLLPQNCTSNCFPSSGNFQISKVFIVASCCCQAFVFLKVRYANYCESVATHCLAVNFLLSPTQTNIHSCKATDRSQLNCQTPTHRSCNSRKLPISALKKTDNARWTA